MKLLKSLIKSVCRRRCMLKNHRCVRHFSFRECGHHIFQKGLSRKNWLFISWSYEQVIEIYTRLYLLQDVAVEIFFSDGQTYLIVFDEQMVRLFKVYIVIGMLLCFFFSCLPSSLFLFKQFKEEYSARIACGVFRSLLITKMYHIVPFLY